MLSKGATVNLRGTLFTHPGTDFINVDGLQMPYENSWGYDDVEIVLNRPNARMRQRSNISIAPGIAKMGCLVFAISMWRSHLGIYACQAVLTEAEFRSFIHFAACMGTDFIGLTVIQAAAGKPYSLLAF